MNSHVQTSDSSTLDAIVSSCLRTTLVILTFLLLHVHAKAIDFKKDIEPILQANCVDCHGPDDQNSQFRLDRLANMLAGGNSGEPAIVPGDSDASFLLKLIKHQVPGKEMPPDDSLTDQEIEAIEQWIQEGAKTPESYGPATVEFDLSHWSFQPIQRRESSDGIDDFILRKLHENSLAHSPAADRRVLIRRLYLVMLGIPPTPEQVNAFVNDQRDDAWQLLVDEILASPHYGERWASYWLDLVRFGETNGFETNRERPNAWHYRDWVIDALNNDKPYDDFVREQIAGDALNVPVGTGFLVAGPYDIVKSQDKKLTLMQRMNELDDIINTTGTAFLGLTTGCARCHNHKFDPISQKDYYSMQAVFAGVNHAESQLPKSKETLERIAALELEASQLEKSLAKFIPGRTANVIAIDDAQAEHLEQPRGRGETPTENGPNLSGGSYSWWTNEPGKAVVRYRPQLMGTYRIWLSWGAGFATHSTDARYVLHSQSGKSEIANVNQQLPVDGSGKPEGKKLWSGYFDAGLHDLEPGDTITIEGGDTGTAVTADVVVFQESADGNPVVKPAWRPPVNAKHNAEHFLPREAKFIRFTINATNAAEPCIDELEIFSGQENVALASLGSIATSSGDFVHPIHNLKQINDGEYGNSRSWIAAKRSGGWVQIELPKVMKIDRIEWARDRQGKYADRVATDYRIETAVESDTWELVASSADRLPASASQSTGIQYAFEGFPEPEAQQGRQLLDQLAKIKAKKALLETSNKSWIGTFSQPGSTHRLYRGEPDAPREEVGPGAIQAFTSLNLDKKAPEQLRRLAFANWVASDENPLTARVIVNRLWQFHFGTGIVDTPSDFGHNGTPPSHPELLDWLAAELIDHDWSLKHIHRLILASETWRQSNLPDSQAIKVDAASRLLWRFPPRRMEAESIRDSILAVSDVLELSDQGGPGFSAFTVEMENVRHYHAKEIYGPEDWRRMIYMTKVRQEKDQVFGAFDCPDASMVVPKRSRSTTPLQALNLLNSNFVLQQADLFAKRLEKERETRTQQIVLAWQLCFQRNPTDEELAESKTFIEQEGMTQFARALLNTNEFVFIP